jgi:hypothetical protein
MHIHPGWLGPARDFGHTDYQAGDSHYTGDDQQ